MTDSPSSDRDELVAAYLDGEATPAERATVEGDAELMARVAIIRDVVSMVAEPVAAPPAHVRRSHIAAALEASNTKPNVASMATRRKRFSTSQIAAVAAAVLALFAVPIALSQGGDDEDTATSTLSAEDESSGDGSQGPAAAGGALFDDDDTAASDDGASDDGAEEAALDMTEADASDDGETAASAEIADDGAESAQEEGADLEPAPAERAFARLDTAVAADVDDLVAQVLPPPIGQRSVAPAVDTLTDLVCLEIIAETAGADPVAVAGTTSLAGEPAEYVVVDRTVDGEVVPQLTVLDLNCRPIFVGIVGR